MSIEDSPRFSPDPIDTDDLYRGGPPSVLGNALRLLATGKEEVREALAAVRRGQVIESDDAIQRFQSLLPELFCCRQLGDGFGAVINALKFVFNNRRGQPLEEKHIQLLSQTVENLRFEPFIAFDKAAQIIARLEDAGLEVDPPELTILTDLLDVKSLR
ncbi:MAG: hypothetical protein ACKV22_24085 [Bryobacteraceae bacterium]